MMTDKDQRDIDMSIKVIDASLIVLVLAVLALFVDIGIAYATL